MEVQRMSEIAQKRIYYIAAVGIVAMVLISVIAAGHPLSVQTVNATPQVKTIQVTGEGTVAATPDEVLLLLAVQTQATTANQTASDNAVIMTRVMTALTNVGVSKSAIQTVSYSLTPIYNYKPDQTTPPAITGYTAENAIQITITDLGSVGRILDTAIAAGANEVQGVTFTFSTATYASLQKQALQLAIQDADSRAKSVASSLGVSIVGPISVTPEYTNQPVFNRSTASAGVPTPIQAGSLQVTADIQITYQIA
jgi:hypothetical protein